MSNPAAEVKTWEPPELGEKAPLPALTVERVSDVGALLAPGAQTKALAETVGATADSPMALVRFAIERGVDPDNLDKLVALGERMEARAAAREFAAALAAFQQECPLIKRADTAEITTSSGGKYSFKYAELDDIVATIRSPLVRHGLSYTWNATADAKDMLTVTCILRHVNGHSESSSMTLPTGNNSGASLQQKYGMAQTYGQRRTLCAVLGIVTTQDDSKVENRDPTPITTEQAEKLAEIAEQAGADTEKLLVFLGVESFSQIPAAKYDSAVSALREKARRKI